MLDGAALRVEPAATLETLDASAGAVVAAGALTVAGTIGAGSRLRARGTLRVGGIVDRAELELRGSAIFGSSVVGSTLRVGGAVEAARRVLQLVGEVPAELAKSHALLGQLLAAAAAKGTQVPPLRAAAAVLDGYGAGAITRLAQGSGVAASERALVGTGVADALRLSVSRYAAVREGKIELLGELVQLVRGAVEALNATAAESSRVEAPSLQQTTADISGDLVITGRGTVSCHLRVSGDVTIAEGGSVRGGTLEVGGTARIAELGTPGGAGGILRLGPGARLEAGIVHANVVVDGPNGALRYDRPRRDVVLDAARYSE